MRLFILAGEPSGDLHGASLIQDAHVEGIEFFGVGGPQMRSKGLQTLLPMEELSVMGITAVIGALPRLIRHFRAVKKAILEQKPEGVILIDYPGFNLRLMRTLRKAGYKGQIIQYVAPSVWAHGKKRAQLLERYADLLLVIYPFEKAYFPNMAVKYVKNPLLNALPKKAMKRQDLIAIFPGSRRHEIHHNLPQMLEVAKRLQKERPELEIAISAASPKIQKLIGGKARLDTDKLMREAKLALAVSGTVTLELALRDTPTIVCYKVPALMHFIGKWILRIRLKHFCIVNILMNCRVFPEFFGKRLDAGAITAAAQAMLEDSKACEKRLEKLKDILDSGSNAAEEVLTLLAPDHLRLDCVHGSGCS